MSGPKYGTAVLEASRRAAISARIQRELEQMKRNLLHDDYIKKVTDFRDHVVSTMPESTEKEDEHSLKAWEDFYELKWTISFAGKEVTLDNEAGTWQPIVDMLTDYLDNYL